MPSFAPSAPRTACTGSDRALADPAHRSRRRSFSPDVPSPSRDTPACSGPHSSARPGKGAHRYAGTTARTSGGDPGAGNTPACASAGACGRRGGHRGVRRHLAALRAGMAEPVRADVPRPAGSTSWITSWIMRPRATFSGGQDERLLRVRPARRDVIRARGFARPFADLVRHRRGQLVPEWFRRSEQAVPNPIQGFVGLLRRGVDAVTADLTLPWSSGVIEGHVSRVPTLKRAMCGRADGRTRRPPRASNSCEDADAQSSRRAGGHRHAVCPDRLLNNGRTHKD
jgi:hypothetical protein